MRPRETTLYAVGMVLAALAGISAVMSPSSAHNSIDWSPPPFISGSQLPAMLNAPDTKCGNHRECTEYEFNDVVGDLQKQWAITPEWVRSKCGANVTVPSMERCIVEQTRTWLGKNSNRQAPWVKPETLGAIAQYAALSPGTGAR